MYAIVVVFVGIECDVLACFYVGVDLGLVSPDLGVLQYYFALGLMNQRCQQFLFLLVHYTQHLVYVSLRMIRD